MATKCANCPLHGFNYFTKVTTDDLRATQQYKSGELTIDSGTPILMEGTNSPQLFTALKGMGLRYKTLPNGERQVINFIFPGDFLGLQAGIIGEMKHSVEATTPMTLCVFDRSEFFRFFKTNPNRGYDITWIAAEEEHFLGATLTTVGQRSAQEAVAWALLKLFQKGKATHLVHGSQMPLPFRQQDLADALGLSLVHTNKTLKRLRDLQLASWANGILAVNDLERLADCAVTELKEMDPRPFI